MIPAPRPWLPASARAPRIEARLTELVERWSRRWLVQGGLRAGTLTRVGDPRWELRTAHWHCHPDGVAVGCTATALTELGARMIGVLPRKDRGEADLALFETLGDEALGDLRREVTSGLELARQAEWAGESTRGSAAGAVHRLEIRTASQQLVVTIELAEAWLIDRLKAGLPKPAPSRPIDRVEPALASAEVALAASLGRCRLTLAELAQVGVGDVLMLDQRLDARLPLVINGVRSRDGSCTLTDASGGMALKIVQPLAG